MIRGVEMQLFAPKYYKDFKCIADRCKHSCCIGWEIDVDEKTLCRYKTEKDGYFKAILSGINEDGDAPHFVLCENERCPHLDKSGLCEIIKRFGDEYLPDICREHPRFYNNSRLGKEVGIGMACEEACRLILSSDEYSEMIRLEQVADENYDFKFDTVAARNDIYFTLSRADIPYEDKLAFLWKKYDADPSLTSDSEWREFICSLEYLYEDHKNLFSLYTSDVKTPRHSAPFLERFLAYMIYRHATPKRTEEEFRLALGLSFFAERLLASLIKSCKEFDTDRIFELARIISEEIEYSEENTDAIMLEFEFI